MSSKSGTQGSTTALRSWAEVSTAALRQNVAALRAQAPEAAFMAVVKANAYGHGVADVARALSGSVDLFGVANLTEARELRAALPRPTPIFILGAALPDERRAIVNEGFIAAVSSVEEAADYARHGKVDLHLAIDTGMGRMGIWQEDALETAGAIAALHNVRLTGLCSHLPSADEDDAFTAEQLSQFHALVQRISQELPSSVAVHVENSAGIIGFPGKAGTLVRGGLAMYGVSPRAEFQTRLIPALTWKARIILVRDFEPGRGVSYGRTYITDRKTRVATISAGYADGYPRQASGRGAEVLVAGKRCSILGRVTMDQIMVDVSEVPAASPGDEVVLIGTSGMETITATEMAQWGGTIAWHIFTGLGNRVVRVLAD